MSAIEKLLNNPIAKSFLKNAFNSYKDNEKIHGIYVYHDEDGNIKMRDYKIDPDTEIQNLKKIIYE